MNWGWFHKLASPPHAYRIAGRLLPWFAWPAGILLCIGLYGGLVLAPADYLQGDSFRIVYVHAPGAWLSMSVYATMAVGAAIGLVWRIKLAHAVAAASAPIGASFTVLALATGAIWGKPTWGTWWVWDARLTSELILLFLYAGVMALRASIDDRDRRRSRLRGARDRRRREPADHPLLGVLVEHAASALHLDQDGEAFDGGGDAVALARDAARVHAVLRAVLLVRLRAEILRRERNAHWLRTELTR